MKNNLLKPFLVVAFFLTATFGYSQTQKQVTIVGVGDIMLGTDFPSDAYLAPNDDCTPLMADVEKYLQQADVTFGNLEGAFADNAAVTKRCSDPSVCYAFRTPTKYFKCLIDAGFDMFSLANNHSGDLGLAGRQSTVKLIEQAGLHHAGLATHPTAIMEKNGLKFGLVAFSPNNGTVQINDYAKAKQLVAELEKKCDVVIVSFHGGAEGKKHQHVTKRTEKFYGENRGNVHEFARVVIDAGADIVFGHGPHVTRAIDLYKNRFIAYSLGNFCTISRMNLTGQNGIAPIIKVTTSATGEFLNAQIIPVKQIKMKGTFYDNDNTVIKTIQSLTNTDFPNSPLHIAADGMVTKKK